MRRDADIGTDNIQNAFVKSSKPRRGSTGFAKGDTQIVSQVRLFQSGRTSLAAPVAEKKGADPLDAPPKSQFRHMFHLKMTAQYGVVWLCLGKTRVE